MLFGEKKELTRKNSILLNLALPLQKSWHNPSEGGGGTQALTPCPFIKEPKGL